MTSSPPNPQVPVDPHEIWQSPFSFRYGSDAMRRLWSEREKRRAWRRVWVALARAQMQAGLVTAEQVADLEAHQNDIDVAAAEALERELKHDLVAELRIYAAQCPIGGRILHVGATSMDIEDNADVSRIKQSLMLVRGALHKLLHELADKIGTYAEHATMGFTHLQPAEPTTLGYRFAQWGQDLLMDAEALARVQDELRGKGMKGATGTSAGYVELLGGVEDARELERSVFEQLDLQAFPVATQTYPRKQDLIIVSALAGLGQSLYRLAYDVRILQSPVIGELMEPFGRHQVGSSAMPFKQNPVAAENVDSLARQLAAMPRIAWDNAAHSHLERTLDDSANRRTLLPESFLLADALVARTHQIIHGLVVEPAASERLLATYGVFSATEKVLMEATRRGGDRQILHEVLREHALVAWPEVKAGRHNPLPGLLASDPRLTDLLEPDRILGLLDARTHVGDAPERARDFADHIRITLQRLQEVTPC